MLMHVDFGLGTGEERATVAVGSISAEVDCLWFTAAKLK